LIELQIDIAQHRFWGTGESLGHVLHDIGVLRGHRVVLREFSREWDLQAQIGNGAGKGKLDLALSQR
jgi:hypothetical protein